MPAPRIKGRTIYKERWYNSYRSMMGRCYNPKNASYKNYGGRGISVCEEWKDPSVFEKWAFANGYKDGLTLDRKDVNGDYCPSNCRWATKKEQANNRRDNLLVTIDGITKTLTQWADFIGISHSTMNDRYFCKGVRGVMLLHRAENTRFKKGYNRYTNSKHYDDYAPTVLEASE